MERIEHKRRVTLPLLRAADPTLRGVGLGGVARYQLGCARERMPFGMATMDVV